MIILFNGRIGIAGSTNAQYTAIAIENDRIVASGSDADVLNLATANSGQVNLAGKTVWPGLTDSHLHLELLGEKLQSVDCSTSTREDCLKRVKDKSISLTHPSDWIRGNGWNQNLWQGGFGTAAELDAVSDGHPVFLYDQSLHSVWVNSAALHLAGIDASTPGPEGGLIRRDNSGAPTGILHEGAVRLVEKIIPPPSPQQRISEMKTAQTYLHSFGITTVNDFDAFSCFETLTRLREQNELQLRVVKGVPFEKFDWAIENGIQTGAGDEYLKWGWLKLFADGALGPQTAAMLQAYETDPSNFGKLLLEADEILERGIKAVTHHLSLATHAIGDRAVREVLKGYALLREYETRNQIHVPAHRIEHLQVFHPDDLELLSANNLVASMQPIHLLTDKWTAEKQWGDRAQYAYAFRSVLSNCAGLVFGSDAPVESPNPFVGLLAAVSRKFLNNNQILEDWHPSERISIVDAMRAYVSNPARFYGFSSGGLNPGDLADIIILRKDPLLIDLEELHNFAPERVMFAGHWTT